MKAFRVIILFLCLGQVACDNDGAENMNEGPLTPELVAPEDNVLLQSTLVTFQWNSVTDPEGEAITYNLQVSTKPDFTNIIFSNTLTEPRYETTLEIGKYYYWRVRAKDASNNTSEFSRRQNLIVADPAILNYPPFPPDLRFPELDEEIDINQARLGWTGFDIDDTDLVYDVYLGTEFGNLTLGAENIETTEVTLNLDPEPFYYWRVEAKDPSGQITSSPIWWFKSAE
ncbi:hypothetical protein E7Z59_09580 [Robertkochia marina]|uniref:Fibronectin type-III domain-containing protein n=1 Tax=Robertkochia marina TaxID=1227945 RepID=A0A4S3M0E3_9FLAO|nr:hypothetical protein [Robertkochia marina]THD67890.1 hypothetical protein E7Z59_09580 [Robertkochia marina]TRZ42071.1 hypothetical protein D3A96_12135 [Robertkochia marina]